MDNFPLDSWVNIVCQRDTILSTVLTNSSSLPHIRNRRSVGTTAPTTAGLTTATTPTANKYTTTVRSLQSPNLYSKVKTGILLISIDALSTPDYRYKRYGTCYTDFHTSTKHTTADFLFCYNGSGIQ